MQIAILSKNNKNNILNSLVPMFGDPFFTRQMESVLVVWEARFRPHVWGFFFHLCGYQLPDESREHVFVPMFGDSFFTGCTSIKDFIDEVFSSPCLGILFSQSQTVIIVRLGGSVFVPMFGDSFFTVYSPFSGNKITPLFSSPCLGILFSLHGQSWCHC